MELLGIPAPELTRSATKESQHWAMTREDWTVVKELFEASRLLSVPEREAYLSRSCPSESLRLEVEALLATYESDIEFLEQPALAADETQPLPDDSPSQVSWYKIARRIGEGGMSTVYEAFRNDGQFQQRVAIKVLKRGMDTVSLLLRFRTERQILAGFQHRHIAQLLDGGAMPDGRPFLVMEFIDGEPITNYCDRRRLSITERLHLFLQVCSAVEAAHKSQIVHRDIKPNNILVTAEGECKLLDFGIAKILEPVRFENTLAQTIAPERLLTPDYASPEQARGETVTTSSDIYSLGVLLYVLLTGRQPYTAKTHTPEEIARTICDTEVEKPSKVVGRKGGLRHERAGSSPDTQVNNLRRRLAGDLDNIVLKAMHKEPQRRYLSVHDLSEDIRRHLNNRPVLARKDSVPYRFSKFARRNSAMLAAAAAVVLSVLWAVNVGRLRDKQWLVDEQTVLREIPLTSYPGFESEPSFSPDGTQVAFCWNGEKNENLNNGDIYVKSIAPGTPLRLTRSSANDSYPQWSPDGRYIAFLRELGNGRFGLFSIPALGGQERKLADITLPGFQFPAPYLSWAPDSKSLIAPTQDSANRPATLMSVRIDTGEMRAITNPPTGSIGDSEPAVSPDGRFLAFVREPVAGAEDLYLLTLDRKSIPAEKTERLTLDNKHIAGAAWTSDGKSIVFSSERDGDFRLWRLAISRFGHRQGDPVRLEGTSASVFSPTISRHNQRLAYSVGTGGVFHLWRYLIPDWRKPLTARQPDRLIASTRGEFAPQYSPDGNRIAFESARSGNLEIWTCLSDGSRCTQLTFLGSFMTGLPHWSPDGKRISFYSRAQGKGQIFVISEDGSNCHQMTHDDSDHMFSAWSRDGRWIYFSSNLTGRDEVWRMAATGGAAAQVTHNGGFAVSESVDGKYLYFTRAKAESTSLWQMPAAGGEETKLLDAIVLSNYAVEPRGIYYMTRPDVTSERRLVRFFRFEDSRTFDVASTQLWVYAGLAVSPDERWLLTAQGEPSQADLVLVEHFR